MRLHWDLSVFQPFARLALAVGFWITSVFLNTSGVMAQRSGGLTNEIMQTYGISARGLIRELDFSPLKVDSDAEPVVIKSGPMLLDEARKVLDDGNLPLAMELFYAHTVSEYDDANEPLNAIRFSQHLRRPVWQIRWGVSLALRGGTAENANPIGGSGGNNTSRSNDDEEENPSQVLEMALGSVATTVGEEFEKRVAKGLFGTAAGILSARDDEDAETDQFARDRSRSSDGGAEANESETPLSILESGPTPPPIWYPGIVFLGEGASADRVEVAREMGIDFLIHFDVALKTDRDDNVENTSRCRIIQVTDGRTLGASKGIDQQEADRYSRSGRGNSADYIKEQLVLILAIMDQKAKVSELPALTKEIAKKRVGLLLSAGRLPGAKRPSLKTLAEIRMYQSRGLLDSSDVDSAFDYIGGAEALFLLYGPLDEKLDRARQWAVDALPTKTSL